VGERTWGRGKLRHHGGGSREGGWHGWKRDLFMLENVESENLFQGQDFLWWEERTETTMGVKKGLSLLSCQQVINKLNLF